MEITLNRNGSGKGENEISTIGELIVNGIKILIIEDDFDIVKEWGKTRIPAGRYKIKLRKEGRLNTEYSIRFKNIHKGMLWLQNVPGYDYIYIHCGNSSKDTLGCLITGSKKLNDNYVSGSEAAYRKVYPIIADEILKGEEVFIIIVD